MTGLILELEELFFAASFIEVASREKVKMQAVS